MPVSLASADAASSALPFTAALALLPPGVLTGFAIVIGLVVGSFLNVVIHRLPIMLERAWRADAADALGHAETSGELFADDGLPARYNLWLPRSACPHCGHVLRVWENIPLVSWLALRGRCSHCHARVSARYPAIEIASAACAAGALLAFGPSGKALAAFVLCASLIAMSAIDLEHQLLPDALTLPLVWAGLLVNLAETFTDLHAAVIGAVAGYLALWCVYWLFRLLRGVEGMGHGDFKLLAALGAWLGWSALPQIVVIAAVAGAIVGLVATASGRMRFEEPLPFGPYLAAGALVTLFAGTPLYAAFAWGI
ncbi:MAG: A24 family peptidase [Paraburkholderia tropica]|uniref:Prepilin leader peptidase/N-methyltransferase n=1 Tax=Paraburkholderia tropica TaxID=92647 RepID=A0ABX5MGL9_9BURK|nr:A24 family peptidase [Paraburkholderia tropica]MBB3004489.1 leader peptidase (prepilin peptidase)/N-methyltransferase [Paraburkholderia tropica]MBB6323581.1 leader peptidase (prepilin peptidase)/N-methyltransferase [Paraburkholderia tropica]MDE1143519.1 A24 family peptidase [Paraburkholderia tropica]PXX06750.1 type 4 prepilin peptidase 1 [Paraburkholderia tropica]PZW72415.1 type 4 prepilin peptidase 1 [Paraburkholderia tropica]